MMAKRERLDNIINGRPVDRAPAAFWLHFPEEEKFGQASVDAHLRLAAEMDTDLIKIMNENVFWDGKTRIDCLDDIKHFRPYTRKDKIFQDQMDLIKRIADRNQGDVPLVSTIHATIASTFHEIGRPKLYSFLGYMFPLFCRERPQEMKNVFRMISESLMELVDCSVEAGADGIFYAVLGAERYFFEDDEFNEFVKPYEQAVYDHIREVTPLNILHVCKSKIALERYASLNPAIVNWAALDNDLPLTEGREKFFPNSVVLGGFSNHSGALLYGTEEEIANRTVELCKEMEGVPYIVGADCSLPTAISRDRIRTVVKTLDAMRD